LYNKEIKERFINSYDNEATRHNYRRILRKAEDMERFFNKDLGDFNIDEIKEVLFDLKPPTFNAAQSYGRVITAYIDWAIKEGIRRNNINPLDAKRPSYFKQFVDQSKQMYFTEKELRIIEGELLNPQDVVSLRLLFEGVNGKEMSELRNLKVNDVNFHENKLRLTDETGYVRELIVDDITIKYIDLAINQRTYIKNNGNISPKSRNKGDQTLIVNDYVIRPVFTRVKNQNAPVTAPVLQTRIKNIKKNLSYLDIEAVKYLTPKNISRSGMIYYAKKLIDRDGGFIADKHYEEIMERFKIRTKYVLKSFLNEELIYDLYNDHS
jgi:hypothetical protein